MSLDQRLCPDVGGHNVELSCCPYLGIRTQRVRCRGRKCSSDVTCDICKDWSVAQWEAFLKKRSYSGHRKSRPSGSALPPAPLPIPPSTSASSETGRRLPSLHPSSLPSEGRGCGSAEESKGVSIVGSLDVAPPTSRSSAGEGRGWPHEGCGFWGRV